MLNPQMVKIWVISRILALKTQIDQGMVLETVGRAKIMQLEEFYDLFNLDNISLEDVQTEKTDLSHIVSHKPIQIKLKQYAEPEETINRD